MIKKWNKFNEQMENWWELEAKESKKKRDIKNKLSLLGKRVRRRGRGRWEEGVIVVDSFDGTDPEYFIMFGEDDLEQLIGLPFQIWDDEQGRFVDDNDDINPLFDLTDEEKESLNLIGPNRQVLKSLI